MNKNTFSNRVTWYNFILCIFVVWIHAQNTDLFTEVVMIEGKPLFNQIEQTIVSDIAVVGVAGFFLCSGYLFYRNYSWGKVLEKYKTRFVGLFIPYVIWTLLYYFIHVGVSYITPLRAVFNDHSNLEGDRGCGTQLQILRIFMVFTVSDPACGALPSYLSADQQ